MGIISPPPFQYLGLVINFLHLYTNISWSAFNFCQESFWQYPRIILSPFLIIFFIFNWQLMFQLSLSGKFLPFSLSQHIHWKVSESSNYTFKVTFCSCCCIFGQLDTTSSAAELLVCFWLFLRITSEILVQTAVSCKSWAMHSLGYGHYKTW